MLPLPAVEVDPKPVEGRPAVLRHKAAAAAAAKPTVEDASNPIPPSAVHIYGALAWQAATDYSTAIKLHSYTPSGISLCYPPYLL